MVPVIRNPTCHWLVASVGQSCVIIARRRKNRGIFSILELCHETLNLFLRVTALADARYLIQCSPIFLGNEILCTLVADMWDWPHMSVTQLQRSTFGQPLFEEIWFTLKPNLSF
jgi:hypothetical protein